MSQPIVLIGFAEALAAPEVAWNLVDRGYRVVAFGRRGRTSALRYSRQVEYREICGPDSSLETSVTELNALMTSLGGNGERAKTLFPLDDSSVLLCSMAAPSNPGWKLAGPQGELAELALNKQRQTDLARESGFHVPTTWLVRTPEEALRIGQEQAFPLILRPIECVPIAGGRVQKGRNWICANLGELEIAVKSWGGRVPLMVQPFIAGTGEGVFGLATEQGVQGWSAHRRLRMMNPHGSGSSACISQVVDPETQRSAETLMAKSGWRGLFMIELLRDDAGKVWFVELNGRPWGSLALSRCQGFEYPVWQVRMACGEEPVIDSLPAAVSGVVCRNVGREMMHLLFVLRGPKSTALVRWPSVTKTLRELLRIRAGDGIYNWRLQDPKVFLADCYNTVHDNVFKDRH